MIRSLMALVGACMLFTMPAKALDIYTVTETELQQQLDKKLPLSGPTKLGGTATLLPGTALHLKANGTIEVEGAFEVRHPNTTVFYRGWFTAVTNLKYAHNALYPDRTALTHFEGDLITEHTGNRWKDGLNNLTRQGLEKALNSPNLVRDILAFLLFKKLEEKPLYTLDGRKPWHALARGVLTEDSFIVSEHLLTIRIP